MSPAPLTRMYWINYAQCALLYTMVGVCLHTDRVKVHAAYRRDSKTFCVKNAYIFISRNGHWNPNMNLKCNFVFLNIPKFRKETFSTHAQAGAKVYTNERSFHISSGWSTNVSLRTFWLGNIPLLQSRDKNLLGKCWNTGIYVEKLVRKCRGFFTSTRNGVVIVVE